MDRISTALKALGHRERLRILALLSHGELTISELVKILGLSQPRITQYIKSLEDAGIVDRIKEGSWVFSRLNRTNIFLMDLINQTLASLPDDDATLLSDRRRLDDIRAERAIVSDAFFDDVASDSGSLGDEYLPRADLDKKIKDLLGPAKFEFMVDLGTGTGRILELLFDRVARGAGVDNNSEMLKVARHKLSKLGHNHLTVRHGDLTATPFAAQTADLVTIHQVLHYLDDPSDALRESARLLQPLGRLLIVDFASHDREDFRSEYAHRRLGFADDEIANWAKENELKLLKTEKIATQHSNPDVCLWLCQKTR